jgi:RNA polymerase sigma factor (sigma-70 family)
VIKIGAKSSTVSLTLASSEELHVQFWQLWQEHQDYLYRCCVKWIGGNSIDAEDALSRVTIKAWEKFQTAAERIRNFKAWISQLTYNLCVDLHRERERHPRGVEDLEAIVSDEQLASQGETPVLAATRQELENFLRDEIDRLSPKLRDVFLLFVDEEQSYKQIAATLNISYENVRQRMSKARAILRERWWDYENGSKCTALHSQKRRNSPQPTQPQPVQSQMPILSEEIEEVEKVEEEILPETGEVVEEVNLDLEAIEIGGLPKVLLALFFRKKLDRVAVVGWLLSEASLYPSRILSALDSS